MDALITTKVRQILTQASSQEALLSLKAFEEAFIISNKYKEPYYQEMVRAYIVNLMLEKAHMSQSGDAVHVYEKAFSLANQLKDFERSSELQIKVILGVTKIADSMTNLVSQDKNPIGPKLGNAVSLYEKVWVLASQMKEAPYDHQTKDALHAKLARRMVWLAELQSLYDFDIARTTFRKVETYAKDLVNEIAREDLLDICRLRIAALGAMPTRNNRTLQGAPAQTSAQLSILAIA